MDGLVSIRGDTSGSPVQALQMDGISLEQDAQLAKIERMQVKLTQGRSARVSGIRMRDRATNAGKSTRLIDVDVAVSGISDSSVDGTAYGVQGLLLARESKMTGIAGTSSSAIAWRRTSRLRSR